MDAEDVEPEEDAPDEDATKPDEPEEDDGLGGQKWECLAITLDELYTLISSLTSRDENEKNLRSRLAKHLVPIFEEYEASRKRKLAQKEKELLNMEKMQHAKRSSRLASKMEHKREEEERRAAEEKHRQELAMAKKEQQKWQKLEKERESRMQTREQRLKEREARRILHEEELATLSENGKKLHEGEAGRLSERNLKAAIDKNRRALMELENVDEDWVFDCICGAYGQVDDGSLSVECEKCKVWQHAKCIGVTKAQVNNDDYHFVCSTCKRKEKEAEEAKIKPHITLKVNHPPSSPSKLHASLPVMNGSPVKRPLELASPIKQQEQRNIQSSPTRSPYDAYQASRTILPPIKYANGQNGDIVRPVSQGSTPVAPQWSNQANGHGQGQTPARLQLGSHLQRQSPFSSPHPLSPTSLPPPFPQYGFGNGNGVGQPPVGQFVAPPSSPAPGASQNGHGHGVGGGYQQQFQVSRRTSVSFPSPLAGAPIITGTTNRNRMEPNAPSGQILPPINATPSRPPSNPASSYTTPAHAVQTPQAPYSTASNGMLHFAAGISPVKHSPPLRPLTAERNANVSGSFNSSFGGNLCTPTQIPPAAKLNPSPRIIDNTPPIKQAPRFVSGPVAVPKGDSAPGGVIAGNSLGDPLPAFAGLGQTGQAGQVGQGAQNGGAQAPVQGQ